MNFMLWINNKAQVNGLSGSRHVGLYTVIKVRRASAFYR